MRSLATAVTMVIALSAGAESFSVNGDDCSARNFHWEGEETYVARQTIDGSSMRSVRASVENAPIKVTGGNAAGYSIDVCKAAARREDLDAIRVGLDGDQLTADGPEGRRWVVMYHIRAPRGAELDLSATNGPLSFKDVDGRITARTQNGPLSLSGVSGTVDAQTTNGPISLRGGAGDVKLRASNGPLTIALDGVAWSGGSLEAATSNGPLTVKLPRGYASGVVIESAGRSPVSCRAEGCERFRAARASGDSWGSDVMPRTIELGSGPVAVRVSTVNGPVTVKDE